MLRRNRDDISKDWKCRYTSSLVAQLSKIPSTQHTVYRGVAYDPKVIPGDILTFKPFTSTSSDKKVADFFLNLKP
jgi:hypothetical protein